VLQRKSDDRIMALLRSPAANIERLSFRRHPIDEEAALGNDTICRGKPSITSTILPLVSPTLIRRSSIALSSRTTHPAVRLVDDGSRGTATAVSPPGQDLHAREHLGLEQSGGIVDGCAHQKPTRGRIERRGDIGYVAERNVRIGEHVK